jgi:hypothetical protein
MIRRSRNARAVRDVPPLITTVPGAMIVGAYAALGNTGYSPTTSTAPAGADTRANVSYPTFR